MLARLVVSLVAVTHVCACTTLAKYPQDGSAPAFMYKAGDELRLQTADGVHELRVALVTDEEVCSDQACVRVDEVSKVERKEISYLKTTGLVLGTLLLVGVAAVAGGGFAFFPGPPVFFVP
jgi:hypothetical protein